MEVFFFKFTPTPVHDFFPTLKLLCFQLLAKAGASFGCSKCNIYHQPVFLKILFVLIFPYNVQCNKHIQYNSTQLSFNDQYVDSNHLCPGKHFLFVCVHFLLENLAFQNPTYQHSRSIDNGTSDKAVDGNSNMIFADGSCTFVAGDKFPWWRVDLGQDEFVTQVYIVNIQGQTRLSKFEIRVGRLIHVQ